jgi:ribosomal protein S18 acetylase RimI-like enzyme
MITIKEANKTDEFETIEKLADTIWREHYIPIVGKPQIDYMLEKFQSVRAMKRQVANGFEYYTVSYEELPVGYLSIKTEIEYLFLSKIYVLKAYRGKGIGKIMMDFIEDKAKTYNLNKIRLTVNKYNTNSIKAYEKMGFKNVGELVQDIGHGFVMDDFEMVKFF